MSKFTVGIEALKRTTKEIEADTAEEAQNIFLGELSRGELPEFDDMWDSIAISYVKGEEAEEVNS